MRRRRVLALLLLTTITLTLTLTTPPGTPAQVGPTLVLTPDSGVPADLVTADGSGFLPGTEVALFLDAIGGTPLNQGTVDSTGQFRLQFPIPDIAPGRHQVIACNPYSPSDLFCPDQAAAALRVLPPPTTTTTTTPTTTSPPSPTTTAPPLVTETTVGETTTSSLSLQTVTTSTPPDPPGHSGPSGVAFGTTSTSLQVPTGFADTGDPTRIPDLEITGVEVTQGIQDMQNRMPLVANRSTLVRVYVAAGRVDEDDPGLGGLVGATPPPSVGPEGWFPVDGVLHLQRGSETKIVYADNGPITAYREGSDRTKSSHTLNFLLDPNWLHGQVMITAFIWSEHPQLALFAEPDAGNNFAEGTVVFHESEKPQVLVWRMDPGGGRPVLSNAGYMAAIDHATEDYRRHHPIDTPNFFVLLPPLGPGPITGSDEPSEAWNLNEDGSEPLKRLRWIYLLSDFDDAMRFHGLFHDGVPSGNVSGKTHSTMTVAWSKAYSKAPAHEQAHMYGIKHVPCRDDDGDGIPDEVGGGGWEWIDLTYPSGFPNCSLAPVDPLGYYGTNVEGPIPTIWANDPALHFSPGPPPLNFARYPFMGYESNRWVDAYHYCLLMSSYGISCNPASIGLTPKVPPASPVDCGLAVGHGLQLDMCIWGQGVEPLWKLGRPGAIAVVMPQGHFEDWVVVEADLAAASFGSALSVPLTGAIQADWDRLKQRVAEGTAGVDAMIRVTDDEGHILVQVPVTAGQGSAHGEDDQEGMTSVEVLPWPDGAASLDLLIGDEVVDSRNKSLPPSVSFDPVDPGGNRSFPVAWSGSDPDGDLITFSLWWSVDAGETWRLIDAGLTDTEAVVDSDALGLAGGEVLLRVAATDGLATASDVTGPLQVSHGVPTGLIVGPDRVPQYSPGALSFHVFDPEDGPIETGSWSSDLDGDLGEGRVISVRRLSVGSHLVSVAVTDSEGNQAILSKTVEVEESDLPAPRLPGSVPEAELILALGPANLDQYQPEIARTEAVDTPVDPAEGDTPMTLLWLALAGAGVLGVGLVWRRTRRRTE